MNNTLIFFLKGLRKVTTKVLKKNILLKHPCENEPEIAYRWIEAALRLHEPVMIARFGAFELSTVANWIAINSGEKSIIKYIRGDIGGWWWNKSILASMYSNAGFFPPTQHYINKFCELMLQDSAQIDILGSWLPDERIIMKDLKNVKYVNLELLNPFFTEKPWTAALKGKKVLVVHPFAETINSQYQNRKNLFYNEDVLPAFELYTIKAVQSIKGEKTRFADWFEALNWMKNEIDKVDYDICLIGCGAYGLPLAAHVKRTGKKAVHLGGSLQLLFGIRGARWDDENYNPDYNYSKLINDHWVKPSEGETPNNANSVEGACYW